MVELTVDLTFFLEFILRLLATPSKTPGYVRRTKRGCWVENAWLSAQKIVVRATKVGGFIILVIVYPEESHFFLVGNS